MKKFLKIKTGASGATGEGAYYAVDRFESIAPDDANDALDIEGFGGAQGVDLSLSTEANKEDEAAEVLLEEIAYGKELVIDALKFSDVVRGPEITAAYTEGDIAVGAAITYTVASAFADCTFKATLTDSEGVSLTDSGTFTDATTPGLSFDDTGATLTAGAGTVTVDIFYPNRSDLAAKSYSIAVTLE